MARAYKYTRKRGGADIESTKKKEKPKRKNNTSKPRSRSTSPKHSAVKSKKTTEASYKTHDCLREFEDNPKRYKMEKYEEYNTRFQHIKHSLDAQIQNAINYILSLGTRAVIATSGIPGSGKSTISKILKEHDFQVLSLDNMDGPPVDSQTHYVSSYKTLQTETKERMKRGENLVLDGTFLKQKQINDFNFVNSEEGYMFFVIHMKVPPMYAYYNNVNRCLDQGNVRDIIPGFVIVNMNKSIDIDFENPNVIVIDYFA
tara:strand:+ start:1885 stop:2658 length:774 start_codon:yes stop_codon:yes gene_type:complete